MALFSVHNVSIKVFRAFQAFHWLTLVNPFYVTQFRVKFDNVKALTKELPHQGEELVMQFWYFVFSIKIEMGGGGSELS